MNEKRRILIVPPAFNRQRELNLYSLMEGGENLNQRVYQGSLKNCITILRAYMATGEYNDETDIAIVVTISREYLDTE